MANPVKKHWDEESMKALIGEDAYNKLGTYEENTGGGTPIPEGKKLEDYPKDKVYLAANQEDADDFRRKNPDFEKNGGIIRLKDQPRNKDGTFGYNSQNKKGLKYASRGETIPDPLVDYVAKWYKEGKSNSDLITSQDEKYLLTFDMTVEELVKKCRAYIDEGDTGRFEALAGKGDIIYKKKADGTDKTQNEIDRDTKVAREKREGVLAKRKEQSGKKDIKKEDYENAPYDRSDKEMSKFIRDRKDNGGVFRRMRKEEPVPAEKPAQPKETVPTVQKGQQPKQDDTDKRFARALGVTPEEFAKAKAEGRLKKGKDGNLTIGKQPTVQPKKKINWNDESAKNKVNSILNSLNQRGLREGKTYTAEDVISAVEEGRLKKNKLGDPVIEPRKV